MKWHYVRYGQEKYVNERGRIIGQVSLGHDEWHAMYGGEALGSYIDVASAKQAVENAAGQP